RASRTRSATCGGSRRPWRSKPRAEAEDTRTGLARVGPGAGSVLATPGRSPPGSGRAAGRTPLGPGRARARRAGRRPCYRLSQGVIVAQEPQERRAGAAARGLHATYVDRVIAPLRLADQSAVEPAQGVFEDRRTRDLGAPRR